MRVSSSISGALAACAIWAAPAAAQQGWATAYPEVLDPLHAAMRETFIADDPLAAMVDPLTKFFPVPVAVTVEIAECGRAGAFYDPARPAVQLCYELLTELATLFDGAEAEEGQNRFVGAFAVVLLHQVGHAMVDLLGLPVGVPAEEAADQFVAVLVDSADGELDMAVDGVLALNGMGVDWENPGSGEAALSGARLDNLLCLLYGIRPERHQRLLDEEMLTPEQANGCISRQEQVTANWMEMLAAHVKGS